MDLDSRIGELAALATAACWASSAILFEVAGRRIGSLSVNLIRLAPAFAFLAIFGAVTRGQWLPSDASGEAWVYLSISGIIGFVIGDMCLFRAFLVLGTRLSALVMSLWPSMAAVMSWLALGETLSGWDLLGMTLTIAGIALAIAERTPPTPDRAERNLGRGLLLALGGALGQAGGLVLSKIGMGDYDPFAATQIRVIAGAAGFAVLFAFIGWWPKVIAGLRDRSGMTFTVLGSIFGPFLGVGLSLFAVAHTATGVGASIMATTPILILPLVAIVHRERIGPLAVAGALVAVGGVAVLFLA